LGCRSGHAWGCYHKKKIVLFLLNNTVKKYDSLGWPHTHSGTYLQKSGLSPQLKATIDMLMKQNQGIKVGALRIALASEVNLNPNLNPPLPSPFLPSPALPSPLVCRVSCGERPAVVLGGLVRYTVGIRENCVLIVGPGAPSGGRFSHQGRGLMTVADGRMPFPSPPWRGLG
jgi:hypothetical protein